MGGGRWKPTPRVGLKLAGELVFVEDAIVAAVSYSQEGPAALNPTPVRSNPTARCTFWRAEEPPGPPDRLPEVR